MAEFFTELRGGNLRVRVEGAFSFEDHAKYREKVMRCINEHKPSQVSFDFGEVTMVDSAALGLLSLFVDKMEEDGCSVTPAIHNAHGQVRKMLVHSGMDRFFLMQMA